jgi:hypothetical protein
MFVPSLSWQMIIFSIKWRKRRGFSRQNPLQQAACGTSQTMMAARPPPDDRQTTEPSCALRSAPCCQLIRPHSSAPAHALPAKNASPFECSLCLSRACLGKVIICSIEWLQKMRFFAPPTGHPGTAAHACLSSPAAAPPSSPPTKAQLSAPSPCTACGTGSEALRSQASDPAEAWENGTFFEFSL